MKIWLIIWTLSTMVLNACQANPECESELIGERYSLVLEGSLKSKIERDIECLNRSYGQFDVTRARLYTGRVNEGDSIILQESTYLRKYSNSMRDEFNSLLSSNKFSELSKSIEDYRNYVLKLTNFYDASGESSKMVNQLILDDEVESLEDMSTNQFIIEKELIKFQLIEMERILVGLLLQRSR